MTLFLTTDKRQLEINDAYVAALAFLIAVAVSKIVNTQARYWSITWDTNIQQKKIPHEDMLSSFLNRISDDFVFQYELGSKKKNEHIQGVFP